jgi:hypothetical protein
MVVGRFEGVLFAVALLLCSVTGEALGTQNRTAASAVPGLRGARGVGAHGAPVRLKCMDCHDPKQTGVDVQCDLSKMAYPDDVMEGNGHYVGDGIFSTTVTASGVPVFHHDGDSLCGKNVSMPTMIGVIVVQSLGDCKSAGEILWRGIDFLEPAGNFGDLEIIVSTRDNKLCVRAIPYFD